MAAQGVARRTDEILPSGVVNTILSLHSRIVRCIEVPLTGKACVKNMRSNARPIIRKRRMLMNEIRISVPRSQCLNRTEKLINETPP